MTQDQNTVLDEKALLPCPFCGGEPERIELTDEDNFGGSVICCKSCGVSSPVHFDRKENLDDSWNRRTLAHPSPSLPLRDEVELVLEDSEQRFIAIAIQIDNLSFSLAKGVCSQGEIAARALLSRLRAGAQEGWRPMDSAPRDGTQFLAFEKGRYFNCWCEYDPYEGGYFWMDDADSEPSPNLWQPLPAAPSPAKEGGR